VHLRRALLLFAIVLGLAAVAASVSRTERGRPAPSPPPPPPPPAGAATARPGTAAPDPGTRTVRFSQRGRPEVRRLSAGHAATVLVAVERAGQAELQGFGETRAADPSTPASFDFFHARPGRFRVLFHPAGDGRPQTLGTLKVVRR
jgi:hypothetical protein